MAIGSKGVSVRKVSNAVFSETVGQSRLLAIVTFEGLTSSGSKRVLAVTVHHIASRVSPGS